MSVDLTDEYRKAMSLRPSVNITRREYQALLEKFGSIATTYEQSHTDSPAEWNQELAAFDEILDEESADSALEDLARELGCPM